MTTNCDGVPPPPKVIKTVGGWSRTIHPQLVSFRCESCGAERQVWQYPGAAPRYCDECRHEAQQAMNTARQREKRKRDSNPFGHYRPPGRPRKT